MVSDQSVPLHKAILTLERNSSKIYPCLSIMEVHKAIHQLFLRCFLTSFNNIWGSGWSYFALVRMLGAQYWISEIIVDCGWCAADVADVIRDHFVLMSSSHPSLYSGSFFF